MKTLPKLFKKTSTGAQQEWEISVDGNVITTRFGQTGGKIQEATDVVKEGKNIGRSNATTPAQQAEAEAQSTWEKKLKSGYNQNAEAAMAGEVDAVIEGGVFPMLAKRFDEDGDKITYPCYVQPKFDGHRCIGDCQKQPSLWSRKRKPITGVPHIIAEIKRLGLNLLGIKTDGELYDHFYKDRFEELSSFIRQVTPKAGHEVVQYHVYDLAMPGTTFHDRFMQLSMLLGTHAKPLSDILIPVETILVNNEDELMLAVQRFLKQGYEGGMVRNVRGDYVFKRSADLQKIKEFKDSEFKIVGIEEGRGKLAGHGIFVCVTDADVQFRAKMTGTTSELKKYFEHSEDYVGKMLTVKYQGITTKSGVPRFPVALRIREEI